MLVENRYKISKINSLIDETFDKNKSVFYQLNIQLSVDGVYMGVYDFGSLKYNAFEHFTFQNITKLDDVADTFEQLTKESELFNLKYKKVHCLLTHNVSTIVPSALYDEEKKKQFLKINTNFDVLSIVLVDNLKTLDAKNIFSLPLNLKSKMDVVHNNVVYNHFSSGILESLLTQTKNQTKKQVFVHIQASHFEVIVLDGSKLIFYNSFNYFSPEDFLYYLLFSFDQLALNPENIEVNLLGEIDRNSNLFALTSKYIRTIKFGERQGNTIYGYKLQTLPNYSYYCIFNQHLL